MLAAVLVAAPAHAAPRPSPPPTWRLVRGAGTELTARVELRTGVWSPFSTADQDLHFAGGELAAALDGRVR